ncbi:MAG TPA: 3'-5' exonuclease, partial [Tissierellaceae bacterium]|nr:3'-5' exonuclease [Tissierellaceae bacterium]
EGTGVCDISLRFIDKNFREVNHKHSLINPERQISPASTGIHGIYDKDVENSPTLGDFFKFNNEFKKGTNKVYIVGHNVRYDWEFIKDYLECEYELVDTLVLAKRYFQGAENYKLQTIRVMAGVHLDLSDQHSASGDTKTLLNILRVIGKNTGKDALQLCRESNKALPTDPMPIGKYRGQPIGEIVKNDPEYMGWMYNNAERLDQKVKDLIRILL